MHSNSMMEYALERISKTSVALTDKFEAALAEFQEKMSDLGE